jgi:transposase-like protein
MATISFVRHQFPPDIIRHAAWLYLRFSLSFRDVQDSLAERGVEVSYETLRRWLLKFGPFQGTSPKTSWAALSKQQWFDRHCHINRFYWSVLTHWQRSVSKEAVG